MILFQRCNCILKIKCMYSEWPEQGHRRGVYIPSNLPGCILKKLCLRGNTAGKEEKWHVANSFMTWSPFWTLFVWFFINGKNSPVFFSLFFFFKRHTCWHVAAGKLQVEPKFKTVSWETPNCSVVQSGDSLLGHHFKRPFTVFICDHDDSPQDNRHILWSQRSDRQSYRCLECCSVWHWNLYVWHQITWTVACVVLYSNRWVTSSVFTGSFGTAYIRISEGVCKKVHQTSEGLRGTY